MNFNDFENKQDLIGKWVLWEGARERYKTLCKIYKVTKTGFRIKDNNREYSSTLFDFWGNQKGASVWEMSSCKLLTDEEAMKIFASWRQKKVIKEMSSYIVENIKNSDFETVEFIYRKLKGLCLHCGSEKGHECQCENDE